MCEQNLRFGVDDHECTDKDILLQTNSTKSNQASVSSCYTVLHALVKKSSRQLRYSLGTFSPSFLFRCSIINYLAACQFKEGVFLDDHVTIRIKPKHETV